MIFHYYTLIIFITPLPTLLKSWGELIRHWYIIFIDLSLIILPLPFSSSILIIIINIIIIIHFHDDEYDDFSTLRLIFYLHWALINGFSFPSFFDIRHLPLSWLCHHLLHRWYIILAINIITTAFNINTTFSFNYIIILFFFIAGADRSPSSFSRRILFMLILGHILIFTIPSQYWSSSATLAK